MKVREWHPYKVFGWIEMAPAARKGRSRQVKCLVAADSQAKVVKAGAARFSLSETGNKSDIEAALKHPGIVLYRGLDAHDEPWEFHPSYAKLDVKEVTPKTIDFLRAAGVFNSAVFNGASPYVTYVSSTGRGSFGSEAQVVQHGENLSGLPLDKVHWRYRQRQDSSIPKTFRSMSPGAAAKREAMAEALAWASEKFGVAEWKRDPFGAYGPADFVTARAAELVAAGKEALGV